MNVLCLVPEEVSLTDRDREGDGVGQGERIRRGPNQIRPERSARGVVILEAVGENRASSGVCSRECRPLWGKLRLRGRGGSCRWRAWLQGLRLDDCARVNCRISAPANDVLSPDPNHDWLPLHQIERRGPQ